MRLEDFLTGSAQRTPDAVAAYEPDGAAIAYGALNEYSNRITLALTGLGAKPGDRIGLCVPKDIAALAAVFGALKAGCAYVPTDYQAPVARTAFIFNDCEVRAIVAHGAVAGPLREALSGAWRETPFPVHGAHGGELVLLAREGAVCDSGHGAELAYILYTSGSTGKPKGVMHSHATALAFIDWCSDVFSPNAADRFSSHAPFHFDLSILDIYVPIKHGGAVVLIGSEAGKQPGVLADIIAEREISIWYSTPSILRMLVEHGDIAARAFPALRIVNFAGEVFPIKHLRALMAAWPGRRYLNLYGPTETNVCTYYEVEGALEDARTTPLPIGRQCSDDETRVIDTDGTDVAPGEEGELIVAGGSVMLGYWNLSERNREAFIEAGGRAWYRTGDIVRDAGGGEYVFVGRRDRMVKRRGYRVELGEIETALHAHPDITEAAAIARANGDGEVEIIAFYAWTGPAPASVIKLKQFCAQRLPVYMSPDRLVGLEALPKTSTDKIDYERLKGLA